VTTDQAARQPDTDRQMKRSFVRLTVRTKSFTYLRAVDLLNTPARCHPIVRVPFISSPSLVSSHHVGFDRIVMLSIMLIERTVCFRLFFRLYLEYLLSPKEENYVSISVRVSLFVRKIMRITLRTNLVKFFVVWIDDLRGDLSSLGCFLLFCIVLSDFTARQHSIMLCRCRVLAMAEASVRLSARVSVTPCDSIKMTQARITKSSLSSPSKTLVSGSVKLFQKFERGHPDRGR